MSTASVCKSGAAASFNGCIGTYFMRIFVILIFVLSALEAMCQTNEAVKMPQLDDIEHVEFGSNSMYNWYDAASLKSKLHLFVATTGTYAEKAVPFQYGKFVLKNGRVIHWMANTADSILLMRDEADSAGQLFRIPDLEKKEPPVFEIWYADGGKGYIDINGVPVTSPVFRNIGEYSEGLAPIQVGDKIGYVNERKELVIKPRWQVRGIYTDTAGPFHDGLARVIDGFTTYRVDDFDVRIPKCGYINKKGEYVIAPKYRDGCGDFSDGLAVVATEYDEKTGTKYDRKLGYMDTRGKWAIKPQFALAGPFIDGYAIVQTEVNPKDLYVTWGGTEKRRSRENNERKSLYLIDTTGKKVEGVPDCRWRYNHTGSGYREGLTLVYVDKNRAGFMDEQCKVAFTVPDDVILERRYFTEGLLLVSKIVDGKKLFGYLDKTGKVAIDFRFTSADEFSEGLAGVVFTGKNNLASGQSDSRRMNCYIDRTGTVVISNARDAKPFKNGLALQHLYTWTISERPNARNIYGYMNKQGKYVWLSPRAEDYLDETWIRENYIGPDESLRE